MGLAYTLNNQAGIYFVIFATVEWVDLFSRKRYVDILLESLNFVRSRKACLFMAGAS